jgi:hypothetical protein
MKCPWYNGTKGIPFSEMLCHHMECPSYNGMKEIPFSEMHCHHILLYNITSKYGKKSGSALRLWKTNTAKREPNKKAR